MDDIGKLVLFHDVVELGGFSAAASKWDLNHSTVSKHVKSLERQLEVQLLERTSRTMRMTVPGQIVFEHSRRIGGTLSGSSISAGRKIFSKSPIFSVSGI